MSHRLRSSLVPILAGAALVLAACGNGDPVVTSGGTGSGGDEPAASDEPALIAPTPIEVVSSGSGAAAAESTGAETSMIVPAVEFVYAAADDLPALPTDDTGYVFALGTAPSDRQIRALADALGVSGEIVADNDGFHDIWRVGPDDASAPELLINGDALLTWTFSSPGLAPPVVECAVDGSPGPAADEAPATDDDADATIGSLVPADPECASPEPPSGVPTVDEAEQRVRDLLDSLGVAGASAQMESFGDGWFVSVTAWIGSTPLGRAQQWNFGFGGDGAIEYAGGQLAEPAAVGPYPLVDLDTAIARLDSAGAWIGGGAGERPGILSDGVAEPAIDVEPDTAVGTAGIDPVDPGIDGEFGEVTVTLVDVEADLWWAWDAAGTAFLLPGYRFIDTDGGVHVVSAVTDEFVQHVAGSPEPAPGDESAAQVLVDAGYGVAEPALGELLGLTPDGFEAALRDSGLGPVRIALLDGEWQDLDDDLQPGRVNVAVADGLVVAAVIELDPTLEGSAPVDGSTPEAVGLPAEVAEVFEAVTFYPACGNEVLVHEGVSWYQIQQFDHADIYRDVTSVEREALDDKLLRTDPAPTGFAAPRVAPPGPGDDLGTLTIWDDGIAMWRSDSGDLVTWLTTEELLVEWVC